MGQYRHHVFVCTTGKTCPKDGAVDVYEAMKKRAAERGLKGVVRINQAGCMNQCGHGPMVVVYPQDIWYGAVDVEGGVRIVDEHLVGGRVVEEYRYIAPPGDNKIEQG